MEEFLECVASLTGFSPIDLMMFVIDRVWESDMPQTAYIVHHIPGRVRLRVPARRHDAAFFADVRERLTRCPSVTQVDINPATAGVLIRYPGGDLRNLMMEASTVGVSELADLQLGLPPLAPLNQRLLTRLGDVNRIIIQTTGGQADAVTTGLLVLLGASLVQIVRGQIFGAAVPLLWYAGQTLNGILPSRT